MSYFREPYSHSKNKIKAGEGLCNYATKFDLKEGNRHRYIRI